MIGTIIIMIIIINLTLGLALVGVASGIYIYKNLYKRETNQIDLTLLFSPNEIRQKIEEIGGLDKCKRN